MNSSPRPLRPPESAGRRARGEGYKLRADILHGAHCALETTGSPNRISLPELAGGLGITTPSIYLHFRSKLDLIRVLADEALESLCRIFETASGGHDLPAAGEAYLRYAMERPAHYRLALIGPDPLQSGNRMANVVDRLHPLVSEHMVSVAGGNSSTRRATVDLFAATHGLASLLASTGLQVSDVPAAVRRTLCPVLRGMPNQT